MNINDVTDKASARPDRHRVGRGTGSGSGGTAGRGHKGAHSRSGWSKKLGFEGGQMPLARRLPKRGFGNKKFSCLYDVVNLGRVNDAFEDGDTVDLESVSDKLAMKCRHGRIKILGSGDISKKLTFSVHGISESARQKVEASGGTVQLIGKPAAAQPTKKNAGAAKPKADSKKSAKADSKKSAKADGGDKAEDSAE